MAKKLIIVESPAKARTIHKILGAEFDVASSMGHLRDLPSSRLGVDIEHDFAPHYIVIQKRRKVAKQLRAEAKGKEAIYLAPDPDREGEAISWHLETLLREEERAPTKTRRIKTSSRGARKTPASKAVPQDGRKIYRITFHEVTPQAVRASLQHPKRIDLKKVNAQQARRILDRLVGYSLSPLLWKKVGRGLSAGRVQSVTLRLIVEREREITAFVPQEYWTITAELQKVGIDTVFQARLEKIGTQKAEITTQADAQRITDALRQQAWVVASVEEKEQRRYPKPPFTTSTLQQEAFHRLGFSSSRTMRIAQQLYEGLEIGEAGPVGLITYMRTDSVRVAQDALQAVRGFIPTRFGTAYLPDAPRFYRSRKSAQGAHEAVRPTTVSRTPERLKPSLTEEQWALYQLIWQRFVSSQMADAVDQVVSVGIDAGEFHLKAIGRTVVFAGWTTVYGPVREEPRDQEPDRLPERPLPPLSQGDALTLQGVTPAQHFTKPPRRYTDASLVKALEEAGIGRPSTYAPIIQTLVTRDYVRRTGGSFIPTTLGSLVTAMLIEYFPEIMDVQFTAAMEEELDQIEEGDREWVSVVRHFYTPFSARVTTAQEQMREVKREVIPTHYVCDACGKPMVIKWGRFGQFLSCSGFPECKTARPVPTGVACPQPGCGGELVERRSRGRTFYGCSRYPTCRHTARRLEQPTDGGVKDVQGTAEGPGG